MTRPIRPHKGGRTARAPEARIRPQTLERIRATMQERGMSFADLLEERYGGNEMSKLLRIQIRDSATSDTFRAIKIFDNGEVEVKRDYGTIGEAARDNFDEGVKVYRGRREITPDYAESGEIG